MLVSVLIKYAFLPKFDAILTSLKLHKIISKPQWTHRKIIFQTIICDSLVVKFIFRQFMTFCETIIANSSEFSPLLESISVIFANSGHSFELKLL